MYHRATQSKQYQQTPHRARYHHCRYERYGSRAQHREREEKQQFQNTATKQATKIGIDRTGDYILMNLRETKLDHLLYKINRNPTGLPKPRTQAHNSTHSPGKPSTDHSSTGSFDVCGLPLDHALCVVPKPRPCDLRRGFACWTQPFRVPEYPTLRVDVRKVAGAGLTGDVLCIACGCRSKHS